MALGNQPPREAVGILALATDRDGACHIMTLSYLSEQKTQVSGRLPQIKISVLTLNFVCSEPDSFKSHYYKTVQD